MFSHSLCVSNQWSLCLAAPHLRENSGTLPIQTTSTTGDFKRRSATFVSPIRNDKQMAHCWSIIALKLFLLSAQLQLAVMKRKYGHIAGPAVLQRLDGNSLRTSDLEPFRTGHYGCWYWQNGSYRSTVIGPNRFGRREERRRAGSTVNIWEYSISSLLTQHLHSKTLTIMLSGKMSHC